MVQYIHIFLKGIAMGIANVIPGVSGGTVALITGIFDTLIDSIKSCNFPNLRLLIQGRFKSFAAAVNLPFLIALFAGIFISILTVAKLFEYLFEHYPVLLWSFFFGLVLTSFFYVAASIEKKNAKVFLALILGLGITVTLSLLSPASENSSMLYLFLCGIIAACSMILPGLSGSFVLILMGNYQLVMIQAVSSGNIKILMPVVLGAIFGILAFSHLLSWVFKHFRDLTISLLSGLILGSLAILWPWKAPVYLSNAAGELVLKNGEQVLERYIWLQPQSWLAPESLWAIFFCVLGMLTIVFMEKLGASKQVKA